MQQALYWNAQPEIHLNPFTMPADVDDLARIADKFSSNATKSKFIIKTPLNTNGRAVHLPSFLVL